MKEKRTCSSILVIIAASEVGGKEWRVGGGNEMHDNNLVTVKGTGGRGACHQKVD